MAVTMREVAAKAGVSPVVVSHVLHKKAAAIRVSDATAQRVREAADSLGYRCNIWARNFRQQQTFTVGAIFGSGFARPVLSVGSRYFACLMDGLTEGAFQYGYSVTLCPQLLGSSPGEAMSDGRFDGLVWYSTVDSEEDAKTLLDCPVPLVLIHAKASDFGGRIPTVICDNDQGIGLAVDHLLQLGHRKIAFVSSDYQQRAETLARLHAFKRHMALNGLKVEDSDLLVVDSRSEAIDAYLDAGPNHTAVVAGNDLLAAEFILRAPQHCVRIPYDLSVVGFDSTSYCNELRPGLTSVSQPLVALGNRAIDLLVKRIKGELCDPLEVVLPCGLDIRGSTSSPAGGQ